MTSGIIMENKRTILLVDDEENILRSLHRVLRRDGYIILQANSGAQGLEILQAHPETGVILSDQRMPHMTGIEFLSQAREMYPDTVRMVLSGYTDLKTVTESINQGEIYKFLTKPWEDELLRANVQEAFEHNELRMENGRLAHELKQINQELEQRVEDKTREVLVNMHALKISQEVLECLPVAVLGIDEDGMLVVVNEQAGEWLGFGNGELIGQLVKGSLPDELCQLITETLTGTGNVHKNIQLKGIPLRVYSDCLGSSSSIHGVVVVMVKDNEN